MDSFAYQRALQGVEDVVKDSKMPLDAKVSMIFEIIYETENPSGVDAILYATFNDFLRDVQKRYIDAFMEGFHTRFADNLPETDEDMEFIKTSRGAVEYIKSIFKKALADYDDFLQSKKQEDIDLVDAIRFDFL